MPAAPSNIRGDQAFRLPAGVHGTSPSSSVMGRSPCSTPPLRGRAPVVAPGDDGFGPARAVPGGADRAHEGFWSDWIFQFPSDRTSTATSRIDMLDDSPSLSLNLSSRTNAARAVFPWMLTSVSLNVTWRLWRLSK